MSSEAVAHPAHPVPTAGAAGPAAAAQPATSPAATSPAATSPHAARHPAAAAAAGDGWRLRNPRRFVWKSALLLVTTLALIPILLYKSTMGARIYVAYLVVIHVVGLATFAYGVRRHDLAPTRRGLYGRIAGLAFAVALLALAEKGLRTEFGSQLFWWSLFGIWALHTFGLALLHLRSPGEQRACPFA